MSQIQTTRQKIAWMCATAMFCALTVAFCSFSIPVPGGHLYLCDVVICTASIILGPFGAFFVGGIGAFLGDLIFYPTPMFVSLVVHGLQAITISVFTHYVFKKHKAIGSAIGCTIGGIILVIGYTIGRAFIYSTVEYAILKIPYEALQAIIGIVLAMILCYVVKLPKLYHKILKI